VFLAKDRLSAVEIVKREKPAVVTLDLGLPPEPDRVEEGFLAISNILEQEGWTKIIIITGQDEKENALKAVSRGAYDFFLKPVRMGELKVVLQRAFYLSRVEAENRELQQRVRGQGFESMLGTSPNMLEVFAAMRKVAPTRASVLIRGETGTGKELIARAIHRLNGRGEGPFVVINCATIPENLLESELFGHEKGAFTGAHARQLGRFEVANGASLFLDEIGELPLELQPKLLRVIQDGEFERLGSSGTIKVDVRVIAATNRNLEEEVRRGRFREDLWYRLSICPIAVPPLRERVEDIALLVDFFVDKISKRLGKSIESIPTSVMNILQDYHWPGNVRELENVLERAIINSSGPKLRLVDELKKQDKDLTSTKKTLAQVERDHIVRVLEQTNWKVSGQDGAAEILGLNRSTLRARIRKLGIRQP